MLGALRFSKSARAPATPPSAPSASASITSGTGTAAMTALISSAAASAVLSRADHDRLALGGGLQERAGPPSAGSCMRTASVGQAALGFPGEPSRIMPAPAAMAPRVHRMAAPSMPGEPAATPTAVVHLLT